MTPESEDAVVKALSLDTPAHKRMDVVEKLAHVNGNIPKRFVENVLVRVLEEDPNAIVRHEAAFSLGSLHWSGEPISSASIDALCKTALHDASSVVRHEAAEALGSIPMPRVRKTLELLLCDSSEDVVETARISLKRHDHAETEN